MNRRKKNNILIGVLCCALVFMGIGYALLNATITIGGNANITGDFNIHFLTEDNLTTASGALKRGITLKNYESSTDNTTVYNTSVTAKAAEMEAGTGVNTQDPTEASFTAILQKPTDYATFTAIAKNYGTIKGIISDVTITTTPSQELSTWLSNNGGGTWSDYFEVTSTAAVDTVLNPGSEYQFTVTVTFKQNATKLPEGALNSTIQITYVQDNGQTYGSGSGSSSATTYYSTTLGGKLSRIGIDGSKNVLEFMVGDEDALAHLGENPQFAAYDSSIDYTQYLGYSDFSPAINSSDYLLVADMGGGNYAIVCVLRGDIMLMMDEPGQPAITLTLETPTEPEEPTPQNNCAYCTYYSGTDGDELARIGIDDSKNVLEFMVGEDDMLTYIGENAQFEAYDSNIDYTQYLGYSDFSPAISSGDYILTADVGGSTGIVCVLRGNTVLMMSEPGQPAITLTLEE